MSWVIKSFSVPVTQTRIVTGFVTIVTVSGGDKYLYTSPDTAGTVLTKTSTITQCGISKTSV